MDNEINLAAALINAAAILFLMTAFIGVLIKIASMAMAIFAYPVYLSLYALEVPQGPNKSKKRRIISLNLPKENPKRFFMNFSAFMVFLFMFPNIFLFISAINPQLPPEEQANIIVTMLYSTESFRLWFNGLALFFIAIIYLISYFTEYDNRDPWEKIENLSIPSLWKSIVKKL